MKRTREQLMNAAQRRVAAARRALEAASCEKQIGLRTIYFANAIYDLARADAYFDEAEKMEDNR